MKAIPSECILPAGAILAEGPLWHEGALWWVDIEARQIHCFNPATAREEKWELAHRVGFIVPTTRGDFVIGTERGLERFDPQSGKTTPVAHPEAHLPENRFNDAKCDPAGRLWAGTMSLKETEHCGSLYRVDASWKIDRMLERVSISNGLAWSADHRTMYYIDSPTRRVDAFDFDVATGEFSNRRTAVELKDGFPDGMTIDSDGSLWVALWGGWAVGCFDQRTGEQLAKVEVPVEAVSSCCFGGANLEELYITTASRDLDEAGKRAQPLAGGIFRAAVRVRGLPAQVFAG